MYQVVEYENFLRTFAAEILRIGGHWGSRFCGFVPFWPRFFGVLDFEARFAGFSPYRRRFTVCRCCSRFFDSFITHTLHAALQRYTDITVSVFNDFGHGFAVFGGFCCGFAVFATPQCPPLRIIKNIQPQPPN